MPKGLRIFSSFPVSTIFRLSYERVPKPKVEFTSTLQTDVYDLKQLEAFRRPFETMITSTSSQLFLKCFDSSPTRMAEAALKKSHRFLFKENRGGARLFEGIEVLEVGAQLRPIVQSVGVGDCFDVAYVYTASIHERTLLSTALLLRSR